MNPGERRYRRSGDQRGFTLIELMVSLVVMTLGLFAVIHLQVVTVRGHSYARERTLATQMAYGVAEEMRNQSRAWVARRDGTKVDFNHDDVFPDIALAVTPTLGNQLNFADVHSLESYAGNEIAVDDAFTSAYLINTFGYSPDSGAATPDLYTGAIFRIHYIGHFVDLPLPAPAGLRNTVRMTVFVSWDNKDHGEGTNWQTWAGVNNFWRRHMVALTFYLNRTRTF